jgi:ferredoxin
MLHGELIYGLSLGLCGALGIFLLDAFFLRRGWCGKLCPLGAFWSLAGRAGQVKVAFDDASCMRCHDCVRVCLEPRVLNLHHVTTRGMGASGECTSCGRCVVICPESSLKFALRARDRPAPPPHADRSQRHAGPGRNAIQLHALSRAASRGAAAGAQHFTMSHRSKRALLNLSHA